MSLTSQDKITSSGYINFFDSTVTIRLNTCPGMKTIVKLREQGYKNIILPISKFRIFMKRLIRQGYMHSDKGTYIAIPTRAGVVNIIPSYFGRGRPKKIRGEQITMLHQQYIDGKSGLEIAKLFDDTAVSTVYKMLKRIRLTKKYDKRKINENKKKLILEAVKQGESISQVAKRFNVARSTIYRWLKKK